MEKITSFKNAQEFQKVFGINPTTGARRNKILLTLLKCKEFWRLRNDLVYQHFFDKICAEKSQHNLYEIFMQMWKARNPTALTKECRFICHNGLSLYNSRYDTDELKGLCEDGDYTKIRVVIKDNGKYVVRKTKPAKVLQYIIKESEFSWLPECVVTLLCEKFTEAWISYAEREIGGCELVVDDNFDAIYDDEQCEYGFSSCMAGTKVGDFYAECVKAKAAYLLRDDRIAARCVIFTDVCDMETGKRYRLAERQYATDQNNTLKQMLISKLIAGGHIDGYKSVGAGCHSPKDFVLNDGTPLHTCLCIGGICSPFDYFAPYMDSFKWYDKENNSYYNFGDSEHYCTLENTNGEIDCPDEYVDVPCIRDGRYVDDVTHDDLDENYVYRTETNEYVHDDSLLSCEWCGETFYYHPHGNTEACYSDFTGYDYCCHDCRDSDIVRVFRRKLDNYPEPFKTYDGYYNSEIIIDGETYYVPKEVYDALYAKEYLEQDDLTVNFDAA